MIVKTELGVKSRKHKGNSKEKDCLIKKLILETISIDPLIVREVLLPPKGGPHSSR